MGIENIKLKSGDTETLVTVNLAGRYLTIVSANYAIEINGRGRLGEYDGADRVDLDHEFEHGGQITIRNTSEFENNIQLNSSPFKSVSQKVANVNADLSNINIAGGVVGIDPVGNGVQVLNQPTVKILNDQEIGISNFPVGFDINNFPAPVAAKKYNVSYETHTITAGEVVAGGWTFNNGDSERLIIKASHGVILGGVFDFTGGESVQLNDMEINQDFVFTGFEGQEIDIIKSTAVI